MERYRLDSFIYHRDKQGKCAMRHGFGKKPCVAGEMAGGVSSLTERGNFAMTSGDYFGAGCRTDLHS